MTILLNSVLPTTQLTDAEKYELAEALTKPSVQKYFKNELATAFKAIANGLPKEGESDTAYLRRQAVVSGQLLVWEVLLSIKSVTRS